MRRLERARKWAEAVRGAGQARDISNALKVTDLPKVDHEFASCNRNAELVERAMNFFDRHR